MITHRSMSFNIATLFIVFINSLRISCFHDLFPNSLHQSRGTYLSHNKNKISTTQISNIPQRLELSSQKVSKSSEKKSFKRFMQVELWRSPELEDLYPVLCSIEVARRDINRLMRRVSTDKLDGLYSNSDSFAKTSIN